MSRFDDLCEVIVSDADVVPDRYGNLQMRSSHRGVQEAERLGAKYVLKTRSDQRFGNNFLLQSLLAFHSHFSIEPGANQAGRLITCSLDTFLYRIYGVSDMMTFGKTEDVKAFWSGDYLDNDRSLAGVPVEALYCANFLNRIGDRPDWTMAHYLRVLRERFLVLDASALGLAWPKYQSTENRWSSAGTPAHLEEITFGKWLAINMDHFGVDPTLLERPWPEV